MQKKPATTSERTFNWVAAVLLGLPGLYDAITGSIEGKTGEALYGLGKVLCGVFFLLHALNPEGLPLRTRAFMGGLLLLGLAIGVAGFLLKRGII